MDLFDILLARANSGGGGGDAGGGVLKATATFDDSTGAWTLDKTWQEIHDSTFTVAEVKWNDGYEDHITTYYAWDVVRYNDEPPLFTVSLYSPNTGGVDAEATSADGYPSWLD